MTDACQVCGSPAHARLCDTHRDELADVLHQLANTVDEHGRAKQGLAEDILDTVYRLDHTGPRVPVTSSAEPRGVDYHTRAADVRDHVRNTITTWARDVAETHPHLTLPTTVPAACAWLATLVGLLAQHEAAGELYADIIGLPGRIRRVVQPPDLIYLGICSARIGDSECPDELFADRDDDRPLTQCRRCGTWWEISDRRQVMLRAMEDQLLTATDMRTVLTRYMPSGVPPVGTIRRWASIGKLTRKPAHPGKPREPRYRVGDVLDLISKQNREVT